MPQASIYFHSESIDFRLRSIRKIRQWILQSVVNEKYTTGVLNYIFCNEAYLLKINQDYLKHDYHTDIITFDYSEGNCISSDMYISIDMIKFNARVNKMKTVDELHRIMIHGVLHLLGYNDKSEQEKLVMTAKEDYYLSLRDF